MRPGMRRTKLFAAGHDAEVGAAVLHRRAERVAFGDGDVGAPIAGTLQEAEADRVERGDDERAGVVSDFGEAGGVFDAAEEVWLLDDDAGGFVIDGGGQIFRFDDAARRADGDELRRRGFRDTWRSFGGTRDARSRRVTTLPSRFVPLMAISTASAAALPPS